MKSVQPLLKFKTNPDIQNKQGFTPLVFTTGFRYNNIVELLVKYSTSIDFKWNSFSVLMIATFCDNPDLTAILLKTKANVNIQNERGWTALFMAVGGANAVTPLHEACATGRVDIVQLLLLNNANPNTLNSSGLTPLCVAAVNGHVELVDILLKAGAQADLQRTDKDWTPLFFAAVGGHFKVVELLLKYGASLKENKHGVTPQAAAYVAGKHDVADHLSEIAASTGQLSLPSSLPLVPTASTSVDTDQSSVESQTTSLDEFISQTPLVNEEENTLNRLLTQPSKETVLSYYNKVCLTISSGVEWIQNLPDKMIKRFENYLETSTRLQTHI